MRPQQAPLGEPTRDVALVCQGRVEERRLDYLYEAPQAPPGMAGGQSPRARPGRRTHREGHERFSSLSPSPASGSGRTPPVFGSAGATRRCTLEVRRCGGVRLALRQALGASAGSDAPSRCRPSRSADSAGAQVPREASRAAAVRTAGAYASTDKCLGACVGMPCGHGPP